LPKICNQNQVRVSLYDQRADDHFIQGVDIGEIDLTYLFSHGNVACTYSWNTYQLMYLAVRSFGKPSFHRMKVMDHFQVVG
jgi:hypothetical protein